MWIKYKDGSDIGTIGSEGGEIITDEEYKNLCHITLEKCIDRYAITCGIYGAMVHTAFCDSENPYEKYEAMKKELADFIDRDTSESEEYEFYQRFTAKF